MSGIFADPRPRVNVIAVFRDAERFDSHQIDKPSRCEVVRGWRFFQIGEGVSPRTLA